LKKPAKTREELGAAIRLEMEDICELPTDLAISVVPYEDTWKVAIMTDGPQDQAHLKTAPAVGDKLGPAFQCAGANLEPSQGNYSAANIARI
jgi:hypothetical protein